MLHIKSFAFNPYQENTYVLYDDEKNCAIVDPGMYGTQEQELFKDFILSNGLKPQWLWNTHCHVDHVLGNHFIYETFGLKPLFNEGSCPY